MSDVTLQLEDVPFEELVRDDPQHGINFVAVCRKLSKQFGYLLGKGVSMRVTCDTNRKHKRDGSGLIRGTRHLFATFRWRNKNFCKLYLIYTYTEDEPDATVYVLKESVIEGDRHLNIGFSANRDLHSRPLFNLQSGDVQNCIKEAIRSAVPFVAENMVPALTQELMNEEVSFLPSSVKEAAGEAMKEQVLQAHNKTAWAD